MAWYEKFYGSDFDSVVGFPGGNVTARQAAFVIDTLGLQKGDNLLDLACGYGRHSILFAEEGLDVIGIDLSANYIEKARKSAGKKGLRIEFAVADMREIQYENAFNAVVNMFTSFGFFPTKDEDVQVLTGAARALKPGGRLLIDYENPFYFVSHYINKNRTAEITLDDGSIAIIEHDFDVSNQREKMSARIRLPDGTENESGYDIRLYNPPEMEAMLAKAGLAVREWFGDFEGNPPSPEAPRLIVVAEKV